MKTIKITKIFTDLTEGIKASNQSYGIGYYATSELNSRKKLLEKVHNFYLLENGELAYVSWFMNRKTNTKYGILHVFDWMSCLDNSPAALASFEKGENGEKTAIRVGNYQFHRDDLRGDGYIWTTETF